MSESPCFSAFKLTAKGITVVLNYPQIILFCYLHHCFKIKRISKSVCQKYAACLWSYRLPEHFDVNIVFRNCDINKNRNQSILDNRGYSCRKSCRHGNDFISPLQSFVAKLLRGQCRKCQQIG